MAQLTIDSTYSRDVRVAPTAAGSNNDGSDSVGVGDTNTRVYRTGIRFPLTDALLTGKTITAVELIVNVLSVHSVSADSWYVGAYNGNGAADPSADTVTVQFGRCEVSGDNYGAFTAYRSTGSQTITLAGAAADVQALLGATFSVGIRQVDEATGGAIHYIELDETTFITAPPRLRVTYSDGEVTGTLAGTVETSGSFAADLGVAGTLAGTIEPTGTFSAEFALEAALAGTIVLEGEWLAEHVAPNDVGTAGGGGGGGVVRHGSRVRHTGAGLRKEPGHRWGELKPIGGELAGAIELEGEMLATAARAQWMIDEDDLLDLLLLDIL